MLDLKKVFYEMEAVRRRDAGVIELWVAKYITSSWSVTIRFRQRNELSFWHKQAGNPLS